MLLLEGEYGRPMYRYDNSNTGLQTMVLSKVPVEGRGKDRGGGLTKREGGRGKSGFWSHDFPILQSVISP